MKKIQILIGVFLFLMGLSGCLKIGPAPNVTVTLTQEKVERGKYLANHVAMCMDCHSTRDWQYFSGPLIPATLGKGGDKFPEEAGFPGNLYARNITPAGIEHWTDGELIRVITTGVTKDGRAIFPLMPYVMYGKMAQEDVEAIVAYLRQLSPIENHVPASDLNFPMNFIVKTIPQPADPQPRPAPSNELAYGEYMITIAACAACHTPRDKGDPLPGMDFAGGGKFLLPTGGTAYASNITPDPETGIGQWSKEEFIQKFKSYATVEGSQIPVQRNTFNSIMPWVMYSGMTETDLSAIYTYLKSLKPVKNQVTKFVPQP